MKKMEVLKAQLERYTSTEFVANLNEEEIMAMIEIMEKDNNSRKKYYRNLDVVESLAISVEAYGYMINMFNIGSLNRDNFEKVIQICMHLYYINQNSVNRETIEKIITLVNFTGFSQYSIKELIETLINDNKHLMGSYKIKQ